MEPKIEQGAGKESPRAPVGPGEGKVTMAALTALERILRKGTVDTRPEVDAERIARVAAKHGIPADELREAAADIRDVSRRPTLPVATAVWRLLGDPGAAVLDMAAQILGLNTGSNAAVFTTEQGE
jgi:protein-disulfide isomerase-like protein with CxxC motif